MLEDAYAIFGGLTVRRVFVGVGGWDTNLQGLL